jgi:hypothetical protein
MKMLKFALAFATLLVAEGASAQNINTVGTYFVGIAGSTITRPADTTTYTANTTICAAKSVTTCVPGTVNIGSSGGREIQRVYLLKSGSTVTSAQFTIWLYSATPGLTNPTQFDNVSYTGPRAADMPNYLGNATCNTPVLTSDTSAQTWFECTLSNPNTSGASPWINVSSISYLITTTAAYAPTSAETFTPYFAGFY